MPKRKAVESTSEKKRTTHNQDPNSWREVLYFWHGTLSTDESSGETIWEGTWIASEDGLPSTAEFDTSENTFRLTSSAFYVRDGVPLEARCPFGRSGHFAGYFLLDGKDCSDIEHRLVFKDQLVAARGTAFFGEFISAGRLVFPQGSASAYLTLARRYLTEDDLRVKLTAWAALLQIEENMERRDSPWNHLLGG